MQAVRSALGGAAQRYSAKKVTVPVNFFCPARGAKSVSVIGDFNKWEPNAHPMKRQPDGSWSVQILLHHGHHQYQFLIDGQAMLDPRAQGITRNANQERVSMIAVS